jgi:glycosyltransferase involved in cell wall biosynthesis
LESAGEGSTLVEKGNYFVWTTNAGEHKNHLLTLQALARYYEINRGGLDCHITGVDSSLFNPKRKQGSELRPHITAVRDYLSERPQLAERIVFHGDLPYQQYLSVISHARFLLHNVVMDNGTLSAVEAAYHRTPVLSSNYPPMRYISKRYELNATFFDPIDPDELSEKLAWMEVNWRAQQQRLPDVKHLEKFSWKALAPEFWRQISTIIG